MVLEKFLEDLQVYGWKGRKNSSRRFSFVLVSCVPDGKRLRLGSRVRGSPPSSRTPGFLCFLSVLPIASSAPASRSRWPDQLEKLCERILCSRVMPWLAPGFAFCFCWPKIPGKIPDSQALCLRSLLAKGKDASFSLEYLHFSHTGDSRGSPGKAGT